MSEPGSLRDLAKLMSDSRDKAVPEHTGWLRSSSIAYYCFRAEALAHRYNVARAEEISSDVNINFAYGTAVHWGLQNLLFRDVLRGIWRCDGCAHRHGPQDIKDQLYALRDAGYDTTKRDPGMRLCADFIQRSVLRPEACEKCGSDELYYEESWLGDFGIGLGGHMDGILQVPWRSDLGIFEGKTIGWGGAKKIKEDPYIEHVYQVHVYMLITGLKWASILYWKKGQFGNRLFVEHVVERDEGIIKGLRRNVRSYRLGIQRGGLIPRRTCATPEDAKATECALREICFGLVSDAGDPF